MPRVEHLVIVALLGAGPLVGWAVGWGAGPAAGQDRLDPQRPQRHFRVERPAGLSGADALVIYNRILGEMVAGYSISDVPHADTYRLWRRFNKVPYRSAQHGERYVNNYANDAAKAYRRFEEAGQMPVGAVLVKDSFAVTARGDVFSGPLFVMEKMPRGFAPEDGDWRYTMIMPDGSLFGTTKGEGTERVEFCAACHNVAGAEHDRLFFVPEEYRIRFLD